MNKATKTILILLGIIILFFGFFLAIIYSAFGPDKMCGTKFAKSELSPNHKQQILVFSLNCGAISDFSTQISVVNSNYKLKNDDIGNIFGADANHGTMKMDGEIIELNAKWINDNKIEIEYPTEARVFKNKKSIDGIEIIYKRKK